MNPITDLLLIMARLRDPKRGCKWDLQQTFETIAPHTIEESYEVEDAIQRMDYEDLKDELGDLLFHVVFYSQLATERSYFNFHDVAAAISHKMVRRHPDVFPDSKIAGIEAENHTWESLKAKERAQKQKVTHIKISALDGVATNLPALTRATKLQKRASMVGFDWPDIAPVLEKLFEELNEVQEVLSGSMDPKRLIDEIGDLLFTCTNLARHCDIDPETALRQANRKFEQRFKRVEALMGSKMVGPKNASLEEMEAVWKQVKHEETT